MENKYQDDHEDDEKVSYLYPALPATANSAAFGTSLLHGRFGLYHWKRY
jgi:hypothetical protein